MPGRLPGRFFKLVIDGMSVETSSVIAPQVRRRVAEMQVDALYSWDDYTDLLQTIAAKLPSGVLVSIGQHIIAESREAFAKQGFTTVEMLRDWGALFNGFIQGAPARDLVRTESFALGRVAVVAGIAQPASLVEGFVRGVIEVYGNGTVTACEVTPLIIGGANYNRVTITWSQSSDNYSI